MTDNEYMYLNTLFCAIDDEDCGLRGRYRRYLDRWEELIAEAQRAGIDLAE